MDLPNGGEYCSNNITQFFSVMEHDPTITTQPSSCLLHLFLAILGLVSLLRISIKLLKWIYVTFLRPAKDLKERYGPWAMVTGATDGIGKAFALALADQGLNLVLVGRSRDKLGAVREEIRARGGGPGGHDHVEVRTVVVDLSEDSAEWVGRLEEEVRGVEIGVLVNSAGTTYRDAVYFHEAEEALWRNVVRVNVEGTTWVARCVVGGMVERRRGAIVNVGSAASVVLPSFPLHAVYASTKGYINQLSRSLYAEYRNMGIDVQCQIPLYVSTKMVSMRPSVFVPSPEDYVHAAVRRIGYEPLCTPYWSHSIQWGLASLVPEFFINSWRLKIGIDKRRQALNSM